MQTSPSEASAMFYPMLSSYLILGLCVCIIKAADPPCPSSPIAWFTQKLDHTSKTSTETFQQRYRMDTSKFKPGGPILFYQGAESVDFPCLAGLHINDMAEDLGAIVCGLEHRFFGESFPAGVGAENATTQDFKSLTIENVAADSATFVQWIKSTVPGANNSRAIIQGGSYGGSLVTINRIMYPDVFYASWASAPLLRSFGSNLDANDDKFNWWDWVYQDASFDASTKISKALYNLVTCSAPKQNCTALLDSLRLCDSGPNNATEWALLYQSILSTYDSAAQFSYPFASVWPVPNVLSEVINQTLSASDDGSVLRIPAMLKNWDLNSSQCLDWRSANLSSEAAGADIELRPWLYISCNYFTAFTSSIRSGSMFPPQFQTGKTGSCQTPAWESPLYNMTNQQVIEHYGLTAENIEKVGRFLFTQGGNDPTTSVGPPPLEISPFVNASRTVLMHGLAHTEEIYSVQFLPEGLITPEDELRTIVSQHIKGWVAEP